MLFNKKETLFILILIIFSFTINLISGNRGVFPMDTFAFFDTGYRVLNGEHPFKDFWVVSGPFIDYTQAIIFYIFGVSWKSYLINSSLLNSLVVVTSFILFKKLGANDYLNLFSVYVFQF